MICHFRFPECRDVLFCIFVGWVPKHISGVFPLHEFREAGFNYVEMKEAQLAVTGRYCFSCGRFYSDLPGDARLR